MEDTKKEENKKETPKKFNLEIKALVILFASGAFAKLHRKFLASSSETYGGDQVVNWLHHIFHAVIGLAIQIVLVLWVVKFIIAAWMAMVKEIKDPGK